MPASFDRCQKNGGDIRTESLGENKYRHVCYLKGKRHEGYIKVKKGVRNATRAVKE